MRPFVSLCLLATLALSGCASAAPTGVTTPATLQAQAAPPVQAASASAAAPLTRATASVGPANGTMSALDCDRDGHASWSEVLGGLLLNNRRVSAEEFTSADLSRDGKWSEGELSRFLNHRARSSWLLLKPCG